MHHLGDVLVSWGPVGLLILAALENAGPAHAGGTDFVLIFLAAARPADCDAVRLADDPGILDSEARSSSRSCAAEGSGSSGDTLPAGAARAFGTGPSATAWSRFSSPRFCRRRFFLSRYSWPAPGAMGVSRLRFMLVLTVARIPRYLALAYLGRSWAKTPCAWLTEPCLAHCWAWRLSCSAGAAGLLIRRAERTRPGANQ